MSWQYTPERGNRWIPDEARDICPVCGGPAIASFFSLECQGACAQSAACFICGSTDTETQIIQGRTVCVDADLCEARAYAAQALKNLGLYLP